MSLEFYKLMHIVGFVMVFSTLAVMLGTRLAPASTFRALDRRFAILHGTALLLILVSGFGMAARLGLVTGLPPWVYMKIGVWLVVGASLPLVKRRSESLGMYLFTFWLVLTLIAGYLGVFKPV